MKDPTVGSILDGSLAPGIPPDKRRQCQHSEAAQDPWLLVSDPWSGPSVRVLRSPFHPLVERERDLLGADLVGAALDDDVCATGRY